MANKPGLVARMLGRAPKHPVVTTLFTHAIGQPLMVHPVLGEALLGGYLSGAVDAPQPLVEVPGAPATAPGGASGGEVRVLNISGGLVNRPAPGLCDPGPLSYEAIGAAFDEAMSDENVTAVVLRMASPGGMAAGCFDLADRIYAARGPKPIYAMVDDFAYSACYALASACDEIWVTRTAGVGSVGVVCYHVDQSEYDKKIGVKVTPIFAGARKVDFSPHIPLSKDAFDAEQTEVDRLADIFINSVAQYRGLSADAVRATEAGTFNGPLAIEAGFADQVGTMRDLLAHIAAPVVEEDAASDDTTDDAPPADLPDVLPEGAAADTDAVTLRLEIDGESAAQMVREAVAQVTAEMAPVQVRAALAEQVASEELDPALAMALLALDPATLAIDDIPARIEHARKVADLCAAAHLDEAAPGYVTRHTGLEQVRAELAAAVAVDPLPQLVTSLNTGPKDTRRTTLHEDVYSRRRAAAAGTGN
jgi:ClpP class serine protease